MSWFRNTSIGRLIYGGRAVTGFLTGSDAGDAYKVEQAMKNATVYSCLQIVAQGIGEIDFAAPDDPAVQAVLERPNEWQTPSDFWESVVIDMLAFGTAKIRLGWNGDRLMRMAPYASPELELRATPGGMPRFLDKRTGLFIPDREILYIRDVGFSYAHGVSRLEALWPRVKALNSADALMNDTFRNGLQMSFILKQSTTLDAEKRDELRGELEKLFGADGSKKNGIAVLEGDGEITRAPILKPTDADLRELREHLIREIGSVFGIPAFLIGGASNVAYSNTTSRLAAMYRQTFSPIMETIREAAQMKFRTPIEADGTKLLKGDLASLTKDARELKLAGIITANEARRRIGEKPHSETDDSDPADCLVCNVGGRGNGTDGDDRSGEMPTDDGTVGTPTPNDKGIVVPLHQGA